MLLNPKMLLTNVVQDYVHIHNLVSKRLFQKPSNMRHHAQGDFVEHMLGFLHLLQTEQLM